MIQHNWCLSNFGLIFSAAYWAQPVNQLNRSIARRFFNWFLTILLIKKKKLLKPLQLFVCKHISFVKNWSVCELKLLIYYKLVVEQFFETFVFDPIEALKRGRVARIKLICSYRCNTKKLLPLLLKPATSRRLCYRTLLTLPSVHELRSSTTRLNQWECPGKLTKIAGQVGWFVDKELAVVGIQATNWRANPCWGEATYLPIHLWRPNRVGRQGRKVERIWCQGWGH